MLKSGLKIFLEKYRDDLFAIIGGGSLLYFATLDKELGWFWYTAGGVFLVWGIATFCLKFKQRNSQN
ncbi:hypothetical protein [uncultured Gimesia sp.]|uniref:hypothetical protein n=1 Tax=uncultured Gimesia sp. TaxID=1678688 RepID=UPI00262F88F6|nr:hypothetical protein [uncultured Gimesia sp.]